MTIFDAPSRESCIARRERTNTPLQALLMMNEKQYFSAAMGLAHSLQLRHELSTADRVSLAYESITSHLPHESVLETLMEAMRQFQTQFTADPDAARAMIAGAGNPEIRSITDDAGAAELATMTMIVHSLFNLDRTKTHE